MRKLFIDFVLPGMKVGRPICNSKGHVLLNAGVILTRRYIQRLKSMGIPAIYIDDGLLSDVEVPDVIPDDIRFSVMTNVRSFYSNLEIKSDESKNIIGMKKIGKGINDIINQLLESPDIVVNLTDIRSVDEYTFGHSVNVCVLALLTGIKLGYSKAKLYHLAMGALLHDVGKTQVPDYILNKPGKLTEEEFMAMQQHSDFGYEILLKNDNVSRLSALIAQQHHERLNGHGYPKCLKNDEIHEFAQVTGLVDIYDALTADRVYRAAIAPYVAYEMIRDYAGLLFDSNLVNAFLYNVAAFPSGTLVKLNTGEIAGVVETAPGYTTQPTVRILFSHDGRPINDKKEIWLARKDCTLFISSVITDESELNTIKSKLS